MSAELALVVIKSPDIQNLKAFYEEIGIEFKEERHGEGPLHYSANLNGIIFEIYPQKIGTKPSKGAPIGFKVKNLETVLNQKLILHSIEIIEPLEKTEWGNRVVIKDPDGRRVELYES